ncbi:MAG: amidohydrolase, partial [Yaniella sp.]|nr:amidohydrolase [Yaniella sp.]
EDATRFEFGSRTIELAEQSMGGEDFAWMTQKIPGSMLRLGTRTPGGPTYDLHQGDYNPDERAIGVGAQIFTQAALRTLTGAA